MRNVLFVDDEPKIIDGLRRMLRPMRHEWSMDFSDSGAAALAVMAEKPVEVIVSDIRMPEMDGVELLGIVRERYPQVVRIALSGHSDLEMLLESVRATHQFLSKPCEPETLKTTVERACALRQLLDTGELEKAISSIESLPSLPTLYSEIMQVMSTANGSIADVGNIIAQDVGMTAKILQVVNSAFFGLVRHIESPAQAVGLLGIDIVRGLVLSAKVFSQFEGTTALDLAGLWQHSEKVAGLAKAIAEELSDDRRSRDYASMAGMLHDVGRLILANQYPERYANVLSDETDQWSVYDEQQEFGCTHMEVGGYLLGLWGLPNPIVEAVAYHHDPRHCVSTEFGPLTAVHLADAIVKASESGNDVHEYLDSAYLENAGLIARVPDFIELSKCLGEDG